MYEEITPASEKALLLADAKAAGVNVDTGSYINLLASPLAYEIWNNLQRLNTFAEALTMEDAPEEYAIKRCRDFGIERKGAQQSGGFLTFTGEEGAVVPEGTVCKTSDGRKYIVLTMAEIEGGSCMAEAQSELYGAEQNANIGEIKYFDEAPTGILSVTNEGEFSGGADEESIESMKERFYQKVRYAPASGNREDYRRWAMECSGVAGARVMPLWQGAGTVRVILIGEGNTAVDGETVSRATEHIESVRPIGAQVTVESCAEIEITINISAVLRYEATLSDIEATLLSSVKEYFANFEGEYVYLSKIIQLIMDTGNVWSCKEVLLNGVSEDIKISEEQVPKLATISIEVVEE